MGNNVQDARCGVWLASGWRGKGALRMEGCHALVRWAQSYPQGSPTPVQVGIHAPSPPGCDQNPEAQVAFAALEQERAGEVHLGHLGGGAS